MGMLLSHHEGYWPEDAEQAEPAGPYAGESVRNLRKLCSHRGLSTQGSKAELVARLDAADLADAAELVAAAVAEADEQPADEPDEQPEADESAEADAED